MRICPRWERLNSKNSTERWLNGLKPLLNIRRGLGVSLRGTNSFYIRLGLRPGRNSKFRSHLRGGNLKDNFSIGGK